MKRFMIGQFEKFNINKQNRDFRENFFGIEVTQMESLAELQVLKDNIKDRKLEIGIHFPLLKNQWRARDPQYLSKDNITYEESINYMESEFARAEEFNPNYILLHYPKPVILDDNVDWSYWRFYDDTEHYYESEMSYKYFEERSRNFFKILSEQGEKYNFTPVLELDALNKYVYGADGWGDMEPYFKVMNEENDNYKVLFEHMSHLISNIELEECYQWIDELVN